MRNKLIVGLQNQKLKLFSLFAGLCLQFTQSSAQDTLSLYDGAVPNYRHGQLAPLPGKLSPGLIYRVTTPSLEIYLPEKGMANGTGILICPGGSYKVLTYAGEGVAIAKAFAQKGVTAFVLKYRLPDDSLMVNKTTGPLQDAQRAIKLIRENAAKWQLDSHKVGVIGFSAGGHLASTLATHYRQPVIENRNQTSLRPDFLILVYPVISMQDSLTHADSRRNLLGSQPPADLIKLYSNELQVDANTPPTYLTHAGDDHLVDVDNSIVFYEKLRHQHVAAEMHLYPKGGHGYIFAKADWMTPLFEWMKNGKWLK
ncbi:alpha/beta hydrolase [Mucilaginibacter sp. PAMB04274]|uniref:alpha/beta hydrolase n=1 Tax=Mucilaginibacter sp. PAMB04274 TaxID=3138568 RepID=UPI0031F6DDFE